MEIKGPKKAKGGGKSKVTSGGVPRALVTKIMELGRDPLYKDIISQLEDCKSDEHFKEEADKWNLIHISEDQNRYAYIPGDSARVTPEELYESFLNNERSEGAKWFESFLGKSNSTWTCLKILEEIMKEPTPYETFMARFQEVISNIKRTSLEPENVKALQKCFKKYWDAEEKKARHLTADEICEVESTTDALKKLVVKKVDALSKKVEEPADDAEAKKKVQKALAKEMDKKRMEYGGASNALVKKVMEHGRDPLYAAMLPTLEKCKSDKTFRQKAKEWGLVHVDMKGYRYFYLQELRDKRLAYEEAPLPEADFYATCLYYQENVERAKWLKSLFGDKYDALLCLKNFEEMMKVTTTYETFMTLFKDTMWKINNTPLELENVEALQKCLDKYWDAKLKKPKRLADAEKGKGALAMETLKKGARKAVKAVDAALEDSSDEDVSRRKEEKKNKKEKEEEEAKELKKKTKAEEKHRRDIKGVPLAIVKIVREHGRDPLYDDFLLKLETFKGDEEFKPFAALGKSTPEELYTSIVSQKDTKLHDAFKKFLGEDTDAWTCMKNFEEMTKETIFYKDFLRLFKDVIRKVKGTPLSTDHVRSLKKCFDKYKDVDVKEAWNMAGS